MKAKHLLRSLAILPALFAANAQAQMVDCNVFLQGQYVEVGINWNGAFGSSVAAPAGYHPNLGGTTTASIYDAPACGGTSTPSPSLLGFVADPDMDGWSAGTPAYYGDYFVPGDPQEGWSFSADTFRMNAWNQDGALDSTIMGGNISYTTSGGVSTGVWQGSFDSVAIVQITTLDTSALYFNVQVIMTNLASTPRNNVYYLRTVDPDNEEPLTGSFNTRNVIEHQLPNTDNLTTVSAAGLTYSAAYLALSTNDLRAKAFIIDLGLTPGTYALSQLYDMSTTYYYTEGFVDSGDVGIGLVFNIGHLSSVDSVGAVDSAFRTTAAAAPNRAVINYRYAFHYAAGTTGIKNITENNIKVYPNPAKDQLSVTNLYATDHVQLFDMMGREMQVNLGMAHDGNNTFSISGLPSGQYLLQVSDKQGNVRSKTPVQKL